MVNKAKVLAIIPARGGSKSIPRKNIKLLDGIPLLAYSIAAGLQSKLVTRVIVSTDDQEIAEIARRWGAEVPFIRPKKYAQDQTTDLPVFEHALRWLKKEENYLPDIIVQLRPTSPFRSPECVDQAVKILLENQNADSVRTIVPSGQNPYKMWRIDKKGYLDPLLSVPGLAEPYNSPRQKLPTTYWQTGHVDVMRYETVMKKKSMTGDRIYPLMIDQLYLVDIDTEYDWDYAERLIDKLKPSIVRVKNPKN